MVEFNNFWDGEALGKAGPYSSQIFAAYAQDMNAAGNDLNRGVLLNRGNGVDIPLDVQETSPATKSVRVMEGSALVPQLDATEPVGTRWYYNNGSPEITVLVADNVDGSGFDRIDLLVLRSNSSTQTITPVIITGTPAGSPVAPAPVRTTSIYDIELAEITAQNLFVTILDADIDTSVRNIIPVWGTQNGGTGVEGGFVASDMLVFNGTEQGAILTGGGDYLFPIGNDGETSLYDFADIDCTRIQYTGATGTLGGSTPVPFNTDVIDPSGILRAATSGNQISPNAVRVRILGYINLMSTSGAANLGLVCHLYDTVAAAIVTDIHGNDVLTWISGVGGIQLRQMNFLDQIVEFDGTEVLEVRIVGALTNTFWSFVGANNDPSAELQMYHLGDS